MIRHERPPSPLMRECCLVPTSVCKCWRAPANPSFTMPVLKLLSDPGSFRTQVSCCCACVCPCWCVYCLPAPAARLLSKSFAELWRLLSPAAVCQGDSNWLNLLQPTWHEKQQCFCRFTLSCLCRFWNPCVLYCCNAHKNRETGN